MTTTATFRAFGVGGLLLLLGHVPGAAYAVEPVMRTVNTEPSRLAVSINSEHLIELYQLVPDLRIIDARHPQDHRLGHIERSHNLPLAKMDCENLAAIAASHDQAFVFYCNGGAGSSTDAVKIASACGYQRLFLLEGGFIEWKDKDYPFVIE